MFHQSSCIFEEMSLTVTGVLQLLLASKADIEVLSGQGRPGLRVGILSAAGVGATPTHKGIFGRNDDLNSGQTRRIKQFH